MAGLRRELVVGVAPEQKKAISVPDLKKIVAQIPATLIGKRDRAILLVGFAGAFRRSELVSMVKFQQRYVKFHRIFCNSR